MLKIENLTFSYQNGPKIFDSFNKCFEETGLYKISGNNGLGKTTLLKVISQLINPKNGSLFWDNQPLTIDQVNYLSSNEAAFFDQMTGKEGIELFCKLNKTKLENTFANNLIENDFFKSVLDRQFYQMSAGMKRMLLIGILFTKQANIFLLDEPYVGLDKERKKFLSSFLTNISNKCLIIIASHEDIKELNFKDDILLAATGMA